MSHTKNLFSLHLVGLAIGFQVTTPEAAKKTQLQFLDWPLEASSKNESLFIESHVKMPLEQI